jgi:adenine-specific DNA-methyltransferase
MQETKTEQLQARIKRLEKENLKLKKGIKNKKFGLVWMDVPEKFEDDAENAVPILKELPEKAVVSEDDQPTHILIEGDNYHALTCLNYTHKGKVDVIYIDPPYNTGKDGFKYKDKRIINKFPDGKEVPKDHPFRHSYWLSFMSKRLELARELLTPEGIMIIHIDENELYNLGLLLCNRIFGEANDLGTIVWNKKNPKGDAQQISNMHEYILCYCRNKERFKKQKNKLQRPKKNAQAILDKAKRLCSKIGKTDIPDEIKQAIKPFNYTPDIIECFKVKFDLDLINKEFANWISKQGFTGGEAAYNRIDSKGRVYQTVSMAWPNKKKAPPEYFIPLIHPKTKKECPIPQRGWRYSLKSMKTLLDRNLIVFGNDESTQPRRKYLLEENMSENTASILEYAGSDDQLFYDLGISFENPKPVNLGADILSSIHPNPKIVVDFFAGSGTALHSTQLLNYESGRNIQCILVTNNENDICNSVTFPRITKVCKGFKGRVSGKEYKPLGGSLKYYETDFIGRNNILNADDDDKIELAHKAGDLLAIAENTLYKSEENEYWQIYENSDSYTAVYFREDLEAFDEFVERVEKLEYPAVVYVFSWGDEEFFEDFGHIDAVKVKTIPLPILEIYKSIYNLD